MIKIALFDMDDTLSASKQPIEVDMGIQFAKLLSHMKAGVVTGAKFEQIEKQFIEKLPEDTNLDNLYCFTQNAASCYARINGAFTQIYSFMFSEEEAQKIIQALEHAVAVTHIVDNEPSFGPRIENRGSQITFSALGQSAPPELKKVFDRDQTKRTLVRNALVTALPNVDIGIGGGTSIDITKKGINKTYAVKWVTENLDIKIDEMVYVGDALFPGGNDAVVISTGISTIQTSGPTETISIIDRILSQ
jgi:HAD superfamily hydrolase (TIGR01484 family)